ncbi:MAG: hypothetical protein JXM75_06545 [Chromatiaceae bacterium]|nr:hypothetical protein [Chromatiaceae bacterium]
MKPLWLSVPAALRGSRDAIGEAGRARARLILPESSGADAGLALTLGASWQAGLDWFDWDVLVVEDVKRGVLETHALDVALSVGRHAAERASLAGVGRLLAWVQGPLGGVAGAEPTRLGVGQWGEPGRVALVGLCVAAAQLGLPLRLIGPGAAGLAALAVELHPGVRDWCRACAAPAPSSAAAVGVLARELRERDAQPA